VALVTEAVDIPTEMFVFKVATLAADDTYDRVATPYDIDTWPIVRDPAKDYYRADTITLNYDAVGSGIKAKADLNTRMTLAVAEYDQSQDSFVEVLTVVHDSEA